MTDFLEAPGVIELARRAPDYADWRNRAACGRLNREDTQEEGPELLTLAQVHDVILRYATDEVTVDEVIPLLSTTLSAADVNREKLRNSLNGSSADAWDMLAYDRVWLLGETRYRAFMTALRSSRACTESLASIRR